MASCVAHRLRSHRMKQMELTQNCVVVAHGIFPSTVAHVWRFVATMTALLHSTEFAQTPQIRPVGSGAKIKQAS